LVKRRLALNPRIECADCNEDYLLLGDCVYCLDSGAPPITLPFKFISAVLWKHSLIYVTSDAKLGLFDLERKRVFKQRRTINQARDVVIDNTTNRIAVIGNHVVVLYSIRLEKLSLISQKDVARVVLEDEWIALWASTFIRVCKITPSGIVTEVVLDAWSELVMSLCDGWFAYGNTNSGQLAAYNLRTSRKSEVLNEQGEDGILALACSSPWMLACARSSGFVTQHVLQDEKPALEVSPLNRLVIDTNELLPDSRRQRVLKALFKKRPPPAYNLDNIVRLYTACSWKILDRGQESWSPEQTKTINYIVHLCQTTEVNPGNITFFIDAIESILRLLYVKI
jgi:hypothetical protein